MIKNITPMQCKPIWPENIYCVVFQLRGCKELPSDVEESLQYVLEQLTRREEAIIMERYKNGCSLRKLGGMFFVTAERIRQIEAKALKKLRHPSRAKYLVNGLAAVEKADAKERMSRFLKMKEALRATDGYVHKLGCRIEDLESLSEIGIERLDLRVRAYNCLYRAGVCNLGDLFKCGVDDLLKIRNLGRETLNEIVAVCGEMGMTFKESDDADVLGAVEV